MSIGEPICTFYGFIKADRQRIFAEVAQREGPNTELFDLAARTKTVLRQNITLACMSIVGASLPALVGAFPLWLAVLLHEGSTLLVAINSVRLLGTFGRQPLRNSTLLATLRDRYVMSEVFVASEV